MANDNGGIIGIINTPTADTASGVWSLDSQYQAQTTGTWPPIPAIGLNSARFNDGSSDNLTKTFSTDGTSADIGTISMWLKRSLISSEQVILSAGTSARDFFRFESDDTLTFRRVSTYQLTTSQVFRDVSAWYHIVLAFDTTQSTASDRIKLYVNGSQVTAFGTASYPSQDLDIKIGSAQLNAIGKDSEQNTPYFDGYMSDVNFVDGQQLDPTSFGAFNANGVWAPIIPTVSSYGTNGFRLKFENSANLGEDSSPNGNNFTVNNLTSVDQSGDYPVNNFATLNPLSKVGSATFSNGNLTYTYVNDSGTAGTMGVTKGKWYWEYKFVGTSNVAVAGIIDASIIPTTNINNTGTAGYYPLGSSAWKDTTEVTTGLSGYSDGMIIGLAFDADNGDIYTWVNGVAENSGNAIITGLDTTKTWLPFTCTGNPNINLNFGNGFFGTTAVASAQNPDDGIGIFEYDVPAGYRALCTKSINAQEYS